MASASNSLPSALSLSTANFSALNKFASPEEDFLSFTPTTFSLQEAVRPLFMPYTPTGHSSWEDIQQQYPAYIFNDACPGASSGTQDCNYTCSDVTQAFNSLETFHNCISYPLVTQLYGEGNISATTSDGTSLENLGFFKHNSGYDASSLMTESLTECLRSYCDTSSECGDQLPENSSSVVNSPDNLYLYFGRPGAYHETTSNNITNPYTFVDIICSLQSAGLNSDVGGIGVFVSYWIQSGLAILGSLFIIWWGWGMFYCVFAIDSLRHGHRAGMDRAKEMCAKYGQRHLYSTIAALAEFQKAQCFFMLAINIAAQVSKHRGNFQPSSLQQLYNNNNLIQAIAVSGYLPITFTLLTLHSVRMVSWYLLNLSILTVAFSVATSFDIGTFAPSPADIEYLAGQASLGGTSACGGKNLRVYCLASEPGVYNGAGVIGITSTGGFSIMAFCIVVLVFLVLDQTGLIMKLRRQLLSKKRNFFVDNFMNIRGLQLLLAVLAWVPSIIGLEDVIIGVTFSLLLSLGLLYIFLASNLRYESRKTWAGKFYNKWLVLGIDIISWIIALICMVFYPLMVGYYAFEAFLSMGFALSLLLWLTFSLTIILTSIHIHGTRKNRPKESKLPSQYSASRRWLDHVLSSTRRFFQPIHSLFKSGAVASRVNRFKRNMKTAQGSGTLGTKTMDIIVCLLYIVFHILYIYCFVLYGQYLGQFYSNVDTTTWSFGQVVAITVWAQPLCEFFHLEIRGMTRGFQHRLMWPYKVVRQDEDVEKGDPGRPSSNPSRSLDMVNGGDQPKRESYEMVRRASSQDVPNPPQLGEDIELANKDLMSEDPVELKKSDDLQIVSTMGWRERQGDSPRGSVSAFSWEQEQEQGHEQEHPSSRRSYLHIPEPDESEIDSFQRQEPEQRHEDELEHEYEPYWQIPESVLLKPNDLGFE